MKEQHVFSNSMSNLGRQSKKSTKFQKLHLEMKHTALQKHEIAILFKVS